MSKVQICGKAQGLPGEGRGVERGDCLNGTVEPTRSAAALSRGPAADFTNIFENAPIGIYQSTKRCLLRANRKLARMFGYADADEMMASVPEASAFFVDPEQRRRVMQEAMQSDGYVQREVNYRRKNGSTFIASLRMRVVRDVAGHVTLFEGFVEDITESRHLEEKIRQTQKMEGVGQLAAGIAHDFNNILAATLMHLGLLRQNPQATAGMKESLLEIESEIMSAASLTRQLLLFSSRQAVQFQIVDMDLLIGGFIKILRRILPENIGIHFQNCAGGKRVKADPGMIEQVVMNLCINARDAMPRGGTLVLNTTRAERDSKSASANPEARAGSFIRLTVRDTGCGMADTVLARIFEPFFTTKEAGKGTGLGLATVYGIIKQHKGWIEVESTVGKGSSFHVYLPEQLKGRQATPRHARVGEVRGGSETILLVEDDLSVRRMTALCLRKLGYGVMEAGNGLEALKIWEQHRHNIRLLLTDLVMPEEPTGLDLARRLKKDNKELRVVAATGYSEELAGVSFVEKGISYLPKPFNPELLAKIVRRCLDQNEACVQDDINLE